MVENGHIKAVHYLKMVPQIVVKGETAKAVYDEILRRGLISKLEHATYLGSELEKAEIASKVGKNYVQDFPLFTRIY
jgi:dihydropteroate synthase